MKLQNKTMKLSDNTLTILKNFAGINNSILVKQGNKLRTISVAKNILAEANITEEFPRDFAIYDLNQFLNGLGLHQDPDLDFTEESYLSIKENVTKLDKIKKAAVPLFCPKCKQVMDKQLDPFYFKAYNECLDCRTVTETQMKLAGTWEDYTNQTFNAEIDHQIEEYKRWFESILSDEANGFVSENGEVQKWVGGIDKERAQQSLDDAIKYLNSLKK